MKKSTAARLACRKAQIEILGELLPLIPGPAMVQDQDGRMIISNPCWQSEREHDGSGMCEFMTSGPEEEPLFSFFACLKKIRLPG